MRKQVKAKVLEYEMFFHGIHCGRAKVKLLEGVNKGATLFMQVATPYKKGEVILVWESIE